jgi:hypothetical protein
MELVRVYEATITDRQNGYAFTFMAIPNNSLTSSARMEDLQTTDALASLLELQKLQPVRPSLLAQAVAGMIQADEAPEEIQKAQVEAVLAQVLQTPSQPGPHQAFKPELLTFAEQVTLTNVVPFEESPLGAVSLAAKAAAGYAKNPKVLGAFIGVLAGGFTPLLLVTVPGGIILCATASAIADQIDVLSKKLCGTPSRKKPKAGKGEAHKAEPEWHELIGEDVR